MNWIYSNERSYRKKCDCNIFIRPIGYVSLTYTGTFDIFIICIQENIALYGGWQEVKNWLDRIMRVCECECACNWAGKISSHNIEIEYRHNRHEVYTHSVCVSLCEEWPEKANEIKIKTKNRQPIVIACWTHAEIFSAVLNLAAINFNLVRNKFIEMEFR